MKNNKFLKVYSLVLSSMVFSFSALTPVCASGHNVKKRISSDSTSVSEIITSDDQAVPAEDKTAKSPEKAKNFDSFRKNLRNCADIIVPVPFNMFDVQHKLQIFEEEIYGSKLFKVSKFAKNIFDIEFCDDLIFRGRREYYDLRFFKNRAQKLYKMKEWNDDKLYPLNIPVYFYSIYALKELGKKNFENKFFRLKSWKRCHMTEKMNKLEKRIDDLIDFICTDEGYFLFRFQFCVESIIESLFEIRHFYETLPAYGFPSQVKDVDVLIAMLSFVDQSIIR